MVDQRVPGHIDGYIRRFWQARYEATYLSHSLVSECLLSEDHRGTPEAPGRVVTLIDRAHYDTLIDHVLLLTCVFNHTTAHSMAAFFSSRRKSLGSCVPHPTGTR